MRSAIVLVGGAARRAGGREKYFFTFRGRTFIDRLIDTLREVVDEIVVVARDPEQCDRFGHFGEIRCIPDIRRHIGPIGGLHAGALAVHGEYVFVAACDMPCINPDVVRMLFDAADGYDAAIPGWNADMLEPLHAVYRRSALLGYLEEHESLSLRSMVRNLDARYVGVETIRRIDPELLTFTNINNLSDLEQIDPSAGHDLDDACGSDQGPS
ncbi:molybdenum cofactor guanylyltransferase [Methanoculleus sp. Wushi-C6]|uniref:Probable molybdenum cofactor guanylyltransferase n=1 Tax=Methanoculleus caldifontis TaxID=2651577 RepID=A0ABU3X127_9EURY|nr:molybdenum cofactor guanylyltransferase [Methanoculleus sp. Wushi-C6]MDV2481767.1 molybdenum cofactor guanylyltransferase [Methanoculleus sp. Wushi-C6]